MSALPPRLLASVGFTTHALDRFAERAGLPPTRYTTVEVTIRDLLGQEGLRTGERPFWARSQNTAELYLQLGEWMLFILEPDRRYPSRYTCVTVVNGPENNDWATALKRGYIHTPPPPVLSPLPSTHVSLWQSIQTARAHRRAGRRDQWLPAHALTVHRAHRHRARVDHTRVLHEISAIRHRYEQARAHARERHAARYELNPTRD